MSRPDLIPPTREELEGLVAQIEEDWDGVSDAEIDRIADLLRAYPLGERVEGAAWPHDGWQFAEQRPVVGDNAAILYVGAPVPDEDAP